MAREDLICEVSTNVFSKPTGEAVRQLANKFNIALQEEDEGEGNEGMYWIIDLLLICC